MIFQFQKEIFMKEHLSKFHYTLHKYEYQLNQIPHKIGRYIISKA